MKTARETAHEYEASYGDCPGTNPKANGHGYSCNELTAAIEARDAELIEACARIFDDRLPEIDGDDIVSNKIVALCAARVRALKEPGR